MAEGVQIETMGRYDDFVSFKEAVGFVAWQDKFVKGILQLDSIATCDFLPVVERRVIRKGHFSQTKEAKESGEYHGDKEEVIMEMRFTVMVDDELEIVGGQCTFTDSSDSPHSHTALEGATNER